MLAYLIVFGVGDQEWLVQVSLKSLSMEWGIWILTDAYREIIIRRKQFTYEY